MQNGKEMSMQKSTTTKDILLLYIFWTSGEWRKLVPLGMEKWPQTNLGFKQKKNMVATHKKEKLHFDSLQLCYVGDKKELSLITARLHTLRKKMPLWGVVIFLSKDYRRWCKTSCQNCQWPSKTKILKYLWTQWNPWHVFLTPEEVTFYGLFPLSLPLFSLSGWKVKKTWRA